MVVYKLYRSKMCNKKKSPEMRGLGNRSTGLRLLALYVKWYNIFK